MQIEPVTLTGKIIRLEPLRLEHVADLALVGLDDRIWHFMLYGQIRSEAHLHDWVQSMLALEQQGSDLPFAVIFLATGRAVGATRYLNVSHQHRAVEIGGTWYGLDYQRTGVNTEAKYLLLKHAFETLGCVRVQIKTDALNEPSQRAIERIGAKREGILRKHMILPDGRLRDSVFYSILDDEWPQVKVHLEELMRKYN